MTIANPGPSHWQERHEPRRTRRPDARIAGAGDVADVLGIAGTFPRPGWVVIDAIRERGFTGEVVCATTPVVTIHADRGRIYVAERATDPPLSERLVAAGALTPDALEQGIIRLAGAEHLGRLFERAPQVDRDSVLAANDLINDLLPRMARRAACARRRGHAVPPPSRRACTAGTRSRTTPRSRRPRRPPRRPPASPAAPAFARPSRRRSTGDAGARHARSGHVTDRDACPDRRADGVARDHGDAGARADDAAPPRIARGCPPCTARTVCRRTAAPMLRMPLPAGWAATTPVAHLPTPVRPRWSSRRGRSTPPTQPSRATT